MYEKMQISTETQYQWPMNEALPVRYSKTNPASALSKI
jgi:hypothetical protein